MKYIKPGIYRHYKGKKYKVTGQAKHSETEEDMVIYQCLYGDFGLWVRPLYMFFEQVEYEGNQVPRFEFVKGKEEL